MNIEICINPNCQRVDDAEKFRTDGRCHPCAEYLRTHEEERPAKLVHQALRRAQAAAAANTKIDMAAARRRDPNLDWFLRHIHKNSRQAVTA